MLLMFTANDEAGRMVHTIVPAATEGRKTRGEKKAGPLLLWAAGRGGRCEGRPLIVVILIAGFILIVATATTGL